MYQRVCRLSKKVRGKVSLEEEENYAKQVNPDQFGSHIY